MLRAQSRLVFLLLLLTVAHASAQEGPDESTAATESMASPEIIPPRFLGTPEILALPCEHATRTLEALLTIGTEGRVEEIEVLDSDPSIERAMETLLRPARFAPATRAGLPVRTRLRFQFEARDAMGCHALEGVVLDMDDLPVVGAHVSSGPRVTVTEADGSFDLGLLAPGRYPLRLSAHYMFSARNEVVLPLQTALVLRMEVRVDGEAVVTVTAGRRERRSGEGVVATETVTREQLIRGGVRNAAEALEEMGSVQIEESFQGSTISLRGLDPEYVLVLVDGDRQLGTTRGAIDLARFGVENIERIEIVRGPSSAIYGSDAIGGVVNIITREATGPFHASGQLSAGTTGEGARYDADLHVTARPIEGLQLMVGGGFHDRPAYRLLDAQTTSGSARQQGSIHGGARLDLSSKNRIRLVGEYIRTDLQGVVAGAGGVVFDRTQIQERSQFSLDHRMTRGDFSVHNHLSFATFREQYLLDQRGSDALDSYEDNSEQIIQISSVVAAELTEDHILSVGFDQLQQSLDSARIPVRGQRYRFALFAQHEWRVWHQGRSELRVSAGLRLDTDSQFGTQLSPKLAARLDVGEDWTFRASYGRGFRAPSFEELLLHFENPSVGYVVEGNPELTAERSHSVDVAATWRPTRDLTFNVALFRNDLQQMISIVTVSQGGDGTLFSYDNRETAWTMGVESSVRYRYRRALHVGLNYALTLTRDGESGQALQGRPLHRLGLSAGYHLTSWNAGPPGHLLVPNDERYVGRTASGTYFKMRIVSWGDGGGGEFSLLIDTIPVDE